MPVTIRWVVNDIRVSPTRHTLSQPSTRCLTALGALPKNALCRDRWTSGFDVDLITLNVLDVQKKQSVMSLGFLHIMDI